MSNFDNFIKKLRNSGLRPTKQRLKICEVLFKSEKTFHFTVSDLTKIIEEKLNEKISLATVYNTVHAFKKKGYLKEISISSEKSYFDTNTSSHHHFYDIKDNELTDIDSDQIEIKNIPSPPKGKSIKDIGVVINVENDSQ
jgi:Fur family iron response transcriptional regulator|tara:strand:+ start:115 stop:534 length:420 start_codon:yes stop_codon:yes gene_type:complete